MNAITAAAGAVATIAIIAAVTFLVWNGSISGEAAMTLFSAVIAGGGVAAVHGAGTRAGADAANGKS